MTAIALKTEREQQLAESFNVLRAWGDRVIAELPNYPDERIVDVCRQAAELERQAFRIRGAGALVIRDRVAQRLAGGRGNRDAAGAGVRAQMQKFAAEVGVDVATVETDARIVETFGSSETFGVAAESLGREYFREALSAPDPAAALEIARRKRDADERYSVRQFRDDVRALREAERRDESAPDLTDVRWYTVGLKPDGQEALARLCRSLECDPQAAITAAVVAQSSAEATPLYADARSRRLLSAMRRAMEQLSEDKFDAAYDTLERAALREEMRGGAARD